MLHPEGACAAEGCRPAGRGTDQSAGRPEGGFDPEELAAARDAGFAAVTVGPRVLRTETAGVAVVAALNALMGDF
jgi:16S rRNA (uracil1498-N3)-methyltransferase